MTLTLLTPQLDVNDVAHGAVACVWWPQPYLCTTLVHMSARASEQCGCTAESACRVSVEGKASRSWWTRKAGLGLDALIGCAMVETTTSTEQAQAGQRRRRGGGRGRIVSSVAEGGRRRQWQRATMQQTAAARKVPKQIDVCGRGSGLSVQKGEGWLYNGAILRARPTVPLDKMLDCCRCRLRRRGVGQSTAAAVASSVCASAH